MREIAKQTPSYPSPNAEGIPFGRGEGMVSILFQVFRLPTFCVGIMRGRVPKRSDEVITSPRASVRLDLAEVRP